MDHNGTERLRRAVITTAAAGAMMVGASAAADAQIVQNAAPGEVSVAIVDSNIRRIDFDDPNVRIVDMTPKAPDGTTFMKYKVTDAYSHGDIVASSFVREYRKLDPTSRIVIYVVDPFIRKEGNASANFSMRIIGEALPKMKAAGVRIAITAFGIEDAAAGGRIADAFARNGMALFAAVPNDSDDRAVYPAASPGVISVASEKKGSAFEQKREMSTWVTFSINGSHGSAHNASDADGTSFSVAHAGAYGAYMMKHRPETKTNSLAQDIASFGKRIPGFVGDRQRVTARIGGPDMIHDVIEQMSRTEMASNSQTQPSEPTILAMTSRSAAGR